MIPPVKTDHLTPGPDAQIAPEMEAGNLSPRCRGEVRVITVTKPRPFLQGYEAGHEFKPLQFCPLSRFCLSWGGSSQSSNC